MNTVGYQSRPGFAAQKNGRRIALGSAVIERTKRTMIHGLLIGYSITYNETRSEGKREGSHRDLIESVDGFFSGRSVIAR